MTILRAVCCRRNRPVRRPVTALETSTKVFVEHQRVFGRRYYSEDWILNALCRRLYAMVAMATADADTAMVDGKLTYSFWRPITAIRNGDQDGNAATERDADWEPLLKTPMHPEYPCGHCMVISALTTVLASEGCPPPPGGIAVMSDAMPGVVRY